MHVSSVPALFDCPSSQLPTTHPYDPQSDAADLGHAVHEALADHVVGNDPDVEALSRAHGVRPKDVYPLVAMGKMAWEEVSEHFPKPVIEHRLADEETLRGRADVFSLTDESMSVLDWKTNRERADYGGQMLGYAACAEAQYGMPDGGHITVAIVWLRLGEIDITRVYQDDIERFHHKMKRALMDVGKKYAPGKPCTYCRRQLVCPAKQEFIQSSVRTLQPWVEGKMVPLHGLNTLYPQAKALGRALEQYKEALKLLVRQHGPQPDGAGNVISIGEETRETIEPLEAWPLLVKEGLSDDELAACTSISSTALLDIVGAKAPHGMKGKAKKDFKQMLRDAGAVTAKTIEKLVTRKGDK